MTIVFKLDTYFVKGRIPLLSLNELIESSERKPVFSKQAITLKETFLLSCPYVFFLTRHFWKHHLMLKIEFCHNVSFF